MISPAPLLAHRGFQLLYLLFLGSLHWWEPRWDLIQNLTLQTSYKPSKQAQRSLNRTGLNLENGDQITNTYWVATMSKEVLKEMRRWVRQGSAPRALPSIKEWTKEACSRWTGCTCLPHARLCSIKESAIKCPKEEKVLWGCKRGSEKFHLT